MITPFYGFLAYVALAMLRPDFMWAHAIQGGRFSFIVALAMTVSWVVRGCGRWDFGKSWPIPFLFGGFWLWSVLGAANAESPEHAWYYVTQMGKILLPFLVGLTSARSAADLKKLAWVIIICEGYVCFEMNMWYFSGYNYLWYVGFGGVDNNSAAIGFVTAFGVTAFMFLHEPTLWKKAVLLGIGGLILHAIQFSFSRGAMLATIIMAVTAFLIIRKTTKHYVMFAGAIVAGLALAGPTVYERFLETFETKGGRHEASAQSRLELWKDCAEVLMRDPIMGCGPDHWPLLAHKFGWEKGKEAHSLWVQTATETGIPGILMFAGFYVSCLISCFWLIRRSGPEDDPWYTDSAGMAIASLCGFGVAAQFVSLEALEVPYYVALLGSGSVMLYCRELRAREDDELESDDPDATDTPDDIDSFDDSREATASCWPIPVGERVPILN